MQTEQLNIVSALLFMWAGDIDSSRQFANGEVSDAILFLRARELENWSRAVLEEGLGGPSFSPTSIQLEVFRKFGFRRLTPLGIECMPFLNASEEFTRRDPCEEVLCLNAWAGWNVGRLLNGQC